MATRFKEGTSKVKKVMFHAYAAGLNSTEIGIWGALTTTAIVACDIDAERVVREAAIVSTLYLSGAAPLYTYVKKVDKAVAGGRKVYSYGSQFYKFSKRFTSLPEMVNYIFLKCTTKFATTEAVKEFCGVEECDAFWWQRPEYKHRIT